MVVSLFDVVSMGIFTLEPVDGTPVQGISAKKLVLGRPRNATEGHGLTPMDVDPSNIGTQHL